MLCVVCHLLWEPFGVAVLASRDTFNFKSSSCNCFIQRDDESTMMADLSYLCIYGIEFVFFHVARRPPDIVVLYL